MCVARDGGARRAVVVGPGRGTIPSASCPTGRSRLRRAGVGAAMSGGGRAGARRLPFFGRAGRAGRRRLDGVMAHLRPWSSRCEHVKAASAAFTHEPCSCGSPAPRSVPASRPPPPQRRWGRGAAGASGVVFGQRPLWRLRPLAHGTATIRRPPSRHRRTVPSGSSQPRVHRVQCLSM